MVIKRNRKRKIVFFMCIGRKRRKIEKSVNVCLFFVLFFRVSFFVALLV